jgi:transposase
VRGKRGRPRRRPDLVLGDRGYDHDKYRRLVWDLGVKPVIARRGTEHRSGLGTQRRVVERAFAHLHWFRRLRIRWEIRDHIHEAFLTLGCALICWRRRNPFRYGVFRRPAMQGRSSWIDVPPYAARCRFVRRLSVHSGPQKKKARSYALLATPNL